MSLDECCEFIDDLARIEVFQVNIGGGEPCLREDIVDILEYCHKVGIVTCLSTNGTTLTTDLCRRFVDMDMLYIQVSIDGASRETNDFIRGRGSFLAALDGVKKLNDLGFQNLSINTVVTRVNVDEIAAIYDMGQEYNAKTRLSRFRPAGRAKESWNELSLTKHQVSELSAFLSEKLDVVTGDSFFAITEEDRRSLGLNMCGAAKMTCSVTPDGRVYPCAFLQEDRFLAGNIREESLGTIWSEAEVFEVFRNLEVEACKSCPRFSICHGGCPAVALFLRDELSCADPECLRAVREDMMVS